jgi:tetratricopeptide (TPR) repeat protein
MLLRLILLILTVSTIVSSASCQSKEIDSIRQQIKTPNQKKSDLAEHYAAMSIAFRRIDGKTALEWAKKSIAYCSPEQKGLVFENRQRLIQIYTELHNTSFALNTAKEVLKQIDELPPEDKFDLYNNMGRCYGYRGELKKQYFYSDKAIKVAREYGLKEDLATALYNRAGRSIREGNFDAGLTLLDEAGMVQLPDSSKYVTILLFYNTAYRGYAYANKGDFESALIHLQLAENYLHLVGHHEFRLMLWEFWAKYYENKGNLSLASVYLDSLNVQSVEQKHTRFEIISLEQRAEIFKKQKRFDEAIDALKSINNIQDSLSFLELQTLEVTLNENIALEIQRNNQLKKSNRLERANLKSKLNYEQLANQRIILIFVGIVIVIISVLIILLFRNRSKRAELKKQEVELNQTKMQLELEKKNADLTNNIVRISNLNKLIREVQFELENEKKRLPIDQRNKMNSIIRKIKKNADNNIWSEFEIQFEQIHKGFYHRLILDFPDLSPNERRLCSFFKLNMRTKEIAEITGQSVNSINVARTRMRKKLGLTNSEKNLIEFMQSY